MSLIPQVFSLVMLLTFPWMAAGLPASSSQTPTLVCTLLDCGPYIDPDGRPAPRQAGPVSGKGPQVSAPVR